MKNIAIIGAGLSGVSCARSLRGTHKVTIFDKSRGVAGRMSTRYVEAFEFDHGAQYFTARDPKFRTLILEAVSRGEVAPWVGRTLYLKGGTYVPDTGGARFVGVPRMNSFVKHFAAGLGVQLGVRITGLTPKGEHWVLSDEKGIEHGPFDEVVFAIPAPQALALLPDDFAHMSQVRAAKMDVCFALMLGFDKKLAIKWASLRLDHPIVNWMAVNSSKPGRGHGEALVIHTAPDWSNLHASRDREWVERSILDAASDILGFDVKDNSQTGLHRWLYASSASSPNKTHFRDSETGLSVCGDWCLGGRVENAFLSGTAVAEEILSAY